MINSLKKYLQMLSKLLSNHLVGKHKKKVVWRISLDNIRVLDSGIDVSGVQTQLKMYSDDWGAQNKLEGTENLVDKWGFPQVNAGVLQLVMGVAPPGQYVGDTEMCKPTPAFNNYTELWKILQTYGFDGLSRCGFLSLPVGGEVGTHIDKGSYYLTRDR